MHTLKLNTDAVKYILSLLKIACLEHGYSNSDKLESDYMKLVMGTNLIEIIQKQTNIEY